MNNTVLVVEDMPIIRDPISATLKAAGYQALCAANGKQALELLRGQKVDLILLDVHMPVMDGLTFLRALRRDSSTGEVPVIMLSGAEDRENILEAAKLGIQGYVLKSHFSLKDLMARVTQHFAGVKPVIGPGVPRQKALVSSASSPAPDPEATGRGASPGATKSAPNCAVAPAAVPQVARTTAAL